MTDQPASQIDSPIDSPEQPVAKEIKPVKHHPFRKALLRGLGFALPPLLTIVLFLWAWNTIENYVLLPVESGLRTLVVWGIADIRDDRVMKEEIARDPSKKDRYLPDADPPSYMASNGKVFVKFKKQWIPVEVYETVEDNPGEFAPTTATAYYHRYASIKYLPRWYVIPIFMLVFILALYFFGKFLTAGVGRILYNYFERLVNGLPIISNVYSSVKQVTDFAFSDKEFQFTRIVAVQYPRKGIWAMGFVTGEGMLDIRTAANEPVLCVLMPTSPMPATGFTIMVPKSETIDLNITMDQAIQFCVSCGVVIPPHQQSSLLINGKLSGKLGKNEKPDSAPAKVTSATSAAESRSAESPTKS